MARNAKIVPAPGAAFARVSFVLAKASSCRRRRRSQICGTAIIGILRRVAHSYWPESLTFAHSNVKNAARMQQRPVGERHTGRCWRQPVHPRAPGEPA